MDEERAIQAFSVIEPAAVVSAPSVGPMRYCTPVESPERPVAIPSTTMLTDELVAAAAAARPMKLLLLMVVLADAWNTVPAV